MARRTKADAQTTRNNLLDAAEQLFQSRGVSHTSLNDIATAAGTTRGAIYWHFKDKADLFNAMMERVTLPLEQTLVVAYVEQSAHPVAEIRSAMLEALRLIATDEQTCRVLKIATHQVEYTTDMGAVLERHRRPASNQRPISARSASVICVALFMGMSFCTTTCW
jgi:TetR/AcrR family acrAB operon transcriptional repressor